MDDSPESFYGTAENPDTGLDTVWYTEDYCINIYYEEM